jgi:hypothetical protein
MMTGCSSGVGEWIERSQMALQENLPMSARRTTALCPFFQRFDRIIVLAISHKGWWAPRMGQASNASGGPLQSAA